MKFRMVLATLLLAGCITQPGPTADSDIAMIMRVANLGEVREGELARLKAADAAVRDFAIMMVTEHTAPNNKAEPEMPRADVPPPATHLPPPPHPHPAPPTQKQSPLP